MGCICSHSEATAVVVAVVGECVGVALQMLAIVGEGSVWTGVDPGLDNEDEDGNRTTTTMPALGEATGIDAGVKGLVDAEDEFGDDYEAYLAKGVCGHTQFLFANAMCLAGAGYQSGAAAAAAAHACTPALLMIH